ncbi:hypothetical protein JW979_09720 [bacterium]|nr:hypothetical protein [candidate division CSSED10-310 bacterium]
MKGYISLLLFLGCMSAAYAISPESINVSVSHRADEIVIEHFQEYDLIRMAGAIYPINPGSPELPVYNEFQKLPAGMTVSGIEVIRSSWERVAGVHMPRPQPEPQILSLPVTAATHRQTLIYESSDAFPADIVQLKGIFYRQLTPYAAVEIHPVRFLPRERSLEVLVALDYRLILVEDPMAIPTFERQNAADNEYPYLIITSDAFSQAFEPLVLWKTQKGIRTRIITLEWIDQNVPGRDLAEKIRNCIIQKVAEWNVAYVLLGADVDILPCRYTFAMDCETGVDRDNELGADLYYADLDGSWDDDGDGIFGEIEDRVDLYPDIAIGRFPCKESEQIAGFVSKIVQYEQNPNTDYPLEMLFLGEVMWEDPFTDGGVHKDMIDTDWIPERFDPINKIYETSGNMSMTTVFNALNAGGQFVNHDGHGWTTGWGIGSDFFTANVARLLANRTRPWIAYSCGCWTAAMDIQTCFGEHMVLNENGGSIAYIGNFRYGWGNPGNPGFGYSDLYDTKFYELLFHDEISNLGDLMALHKAYFAPQSREENVYRWIQYCLNLLGDPEMPIWTDTPGYFTVDCPDSVGSAGSIIPVWVSNESDAIENARVCLYRENECFEVVYSDSTGYAELALPGNISGPVMLTVTGHNRIPYQTLIAIDDRPDIRAGSIAIIDDGSYGSSGNGNSVSEPGETVAIFPCLFNLGSVSALDVTAELTCNNPDITIQNGTAAYGTINPGAAVYAVQPFVIHVDSSIYANRSIQFQMDIQYGAATQLINFFITVGKPILDLKDYVIYDYYPGGDGDMLLEPGETAFINLVMENSGLAPAECPSVTVISGSDELMVLQDTVRMSSMRASTYESGNDVLWIAYGAAASPPDQPLFLELAAECSGYPLCNITLSIPTGMNGLEDPTEANADDWTVSGNGWHLQEFRKCSGSFAYYCGFDQTHEYENDMVSDLISPEFNLFNASCLTFTRWFDFPMYGSDGVLVEFRSGNDWETLYFMGGGGALNLKSDWQVVSVPLPETAVNGQVRFRFISDHTDVAEGIYIDDIQIKGVQGAEWGTEPVHPELTDSCCEIAGVDLIMPSVFYFPGDICRLQACMCNPESMTVNLDLYVILDVYGLYYFADTWTSEPHSLRLSLDPGVYIYDVLPEFIWPENSGDVTGLVFWAGLIDTSTGSLFGKYDVFPVGWASASSDF